MAKAAATAASNPAPVASPFTVETGVDLPAIVRAVGRATSPYAPVMSSLQLPSPYDAKKLQSFFVAASAPDSVTDPAEKSKAFKEDARKIANRVSGIARRLVKGKEAELAYAIRTGTWNGQYGVRVYRVQATPKTAPAAPATPAPQSTPAVAPATA